MTVVYIILFLLFLMGFRKYSLSWIMNFFFYALIVIIFSSIILNTEAFAFSRLENFTFLGKWLEYILQVLRIIQSNAHYIYVSFAIIIALIIFWRTLWMFLSILFFLVITSVVLHFFLGFSILALLLSLPESTLYYIIVGLMLIGMIRKKDLLRNIVLFGLLLIFVGLSTYNPNFLQFQTQDNEGNKVIINNNIFPKIMKETTEKRNYLGEKKEIKSAFLMPLDKYRLEN